MMKKKLVKKVYSKPEVELVVFNYNEIVSASSMEDVDDDEEEIGGDDEGGDSLLGLALPGLTGLGFGAISNDSSSEIDGEVSNEGDVGLAGLFGTADEENSGDDTSVEGEESGIFGFALGSDDGSDTGSDDYVSEDGGSDDGGFMDTLGDVLSGNEDTGSSDGGGGGDDAGGGDSAGDSGEASVW